MPDVLEQMFGTAVVIPDALDRLRPTFSGWTRYGLLDRGSYDFIDEPRQFEREIVELAERTTSRTGLAIREWRAMRLLAGDYVLTHHDRLHDDNPVEVTLVVSPSPVDAEVQYRRRGQVFLRVPSVPGVASVVERGPTVTCNHSYVSKRDPRACVIRIVALLK